MEILNVPHEFMTKPEVRFPLHQGDTSIAGRAFSWFVGKQVNTDRIYVPIQWYSYQINANYAKDLKKMLALKKFVFQLPTNKKYWTITQYADGVMGYGGYFPLNNWRIFGAGGCGTDAIPLTCDKHHYRGERKTIRCSFIGSFNTHPIRYVMSDLLKKEKGFYIEEVNTRQQDYSDSYKKFLGITEKSNFVLCPRGYGKTSFRLYEAMQLGCVPIYISDSHWLPFKQYLDWNSFSMIVTPDRIKEIPEMVDGIISSGRYTEMRKSAVNVYNEYFTYEGCFKTIKRMLEEE